MDVADPLIGQARVQDDVGIRCQKLFQDFLEEFKEGQECKYLGQAKQLVEPDRDSLEVSFADIEKYNQNLATTIIEEYYRVYPYLCNALRNFVKDRVEDAEDKDYYISFVDVAVRQKVRELTTAKVGTLLRISGQVVRTHPVHPELVIGTFTCMDCQTVISNVEQQFKFTYPSVCRNPMCTNRARFMLDVHKSQFVDFQKVRIQETQAELPRGCIPRSVEIILRAEAVEKAQAGDRYDFTGTLIVVPDTAAFALPGVRAESSARHPVGGTDMEGVGGLKALGVRDLHYRLCFLACSAVPTNLRFGGARLDQDEDFEPDELQKQMTDEEWKKIYDMSQDKELYEHLISSLFPTIHGNDEVKRGIILMLFGGVPKTTEELTTLRGDINVCIVGDPSTAKSQFLKQVADFSPRAIYTSGKASTAAGLTAAVVMDEESGDFVIEAGALMLADNGVCCIDEFDKMDPRDQVAIHEAMEQQTISIAKAGVRATLNARTSILAAANPIGGRYDRAKSLKQNVNLTAPIMSRFDLFFVLVDECNEIVDYAIAKKIVDLHSRVEQSIERVYSEEEILRYIMFARHFKPLLSENAGEVLVKKYSHLRQRDCSGAAKSSWRITVRQLESMIRLSEAMARMQCLDEVKTKHVMEAFRLLNKSVIRVEQPDIHLDDMEEEDEADAMEVQQTENQNATPQSNGHSATSDSEKDTQEQQHKKLKLSFDEYKSMANLLVLRMKRADSEDEGMKRSELVAWYLEQIQEEIQTEEELVQRKVLVEKVIDRLVYHDQVLIPLAPGGQDGKLMAETDPIIVVHPNYVLDM